MMMLQYLQNIDATANLLFDETLVRVIALAQAKSSIQSQVAAARSMGQDLELTDEQIDAMALEQYDLQMEMLVAQGIVGREGKKLKTSMTFKQGELMVNGQALPIFGAH